jgi:hypothetical protein
LFTITGQRVKSYETYLFMDDDVRILLRFGGGDAS